MNPITTLARVGVLLAIAFAFVACMTVTACTPQATTVYDPQDGTAYRCVVSDGWGQCVEDVQP